MNLRRIILGGLGLGFLAFSGLRARLHFGLLPDHLTVIYDGSCEFCQRCVHLLRQLDRQQRIQLLPYQEGDTPATYHLTPEQCAEQIWAITPDNFPYPAAAGVSLALATALRTSLPLWIHDIPGVGAVQELIYRQIANQRSCALDSGAAIHETTPLR